MEEINGGKGMRNNIRDVFSISVYHKGGYAFVLESDWKIIKDYIKSEVDIKEESKIIIHDEELDK